MGKQNVRNGDVRSTAAISSVIAHGVPGAIDIGHAINCSYVSTLCGKPYPCRFGSQGAFDAWRHALGDTTIWKHWSAPHTSAQNIRDELMWQLDGIGLPSYFPDVAPATVLAGQEMLASTIGTNLKYYLSRGTIIEATPALEALLTHSDVDLSVPMSMVVLPYFAQYLHFGPVASEHLKIPESTNPADVFDGVFCFFTPQPALEKGSVKKDAESWILELIFACKRRGEFTGHVLMRGQTDRGETTVASWLDLVLQYEAGQSDESCRTPMRAAVSYVVKLFLYMALKQSRVVEQRDYDASMRRLAGLGERKRAKLAKRTGSLYNRIVVGPAGMSRVPTAVGGEASGVSVAPHWRRGHFRMQVCGLRNVDRKLIFVAPTLINGNSQSSDVPVPKPYRIGALA